MSKEARVYAISRWQVAAIVGAIVVAAVSLPVGVMAATGSLVNIRDYANTGTTGYGRVVNNRIVTEQCDPATAAINASTCARVLGGKVSVGDGTGALTVDGSVQQAPTTPHGARISGFSNSSFYPEGSASVPAGKRFVIESISLTFAFPSGQSLQNAYLSVVTGGVRIYHYVPMAYQGTYSGNNLLYYTGDASARLYADAGSSMIVGGFRGAATGSAYINADVSGYLV